MWVIYAPKVTTVGTHVTAHVAVRVPSHATLHYMLSTPYAVHTQVQGIIQQRGLQHVCVVNGTKECSECKRYKCVCVCDWELLMGKHMLPHCYNIQYC